MSDTPLSKLLKQGSSLTSYNIGQVAKLEAQIAVLTTELARVKAERDAALKDAERYRWLRERCDAADIAVFNMRGLDGDNTVSHEVDAAIDAAREG